MKVIFSHPTGNQNSRNLVQGLHKHRMLSQFYTTLGIYSDSFLQKYDTSIIGEIRRRTYDASLKGKMTFRPTKEAIRLACMKIGLKQLVEDEGAFFSVDSIYKDLDKFVSTDMFKYHPDAVYCYGDGAFQTFEIAKSKGITSFYDLPACYWKKVEEVVLLEKEIKPEWSDTITYLKESQEKKQRKDKELLLADHVIVASTFCRDSLKLFNGKIKDIKIIPYGFPDVIQKREYRSFSKLKILFVGKLSQQKGLSYLFEAVEYFKENVELTIIGSKPLNSSRLLDLHLNKHNYLGTMPHSLVLQQMHQHDVLLFPTIMDAFGMVITEAMSQGTPVITTNNSAGPDLIQHEENGWLVNAGDVEDTKAILESLLIKRNAKEFGRNALLTAEKRTWVDYQNDICQFLKETYATQ